MAMKRRKYIKYITTGTIITLQYSVSSARALPQPTTSKSMKFELTPLKFKPEALEPWIDAETVKIHHGKHQATYVENLNAALNSEPNYNGGSLTEMLSDLNSVPESIRTAVRNNGGGVWNHEFYWDSLSPEKSEPSFKLLAAITKSFGSFDAFKKAMIDCALKRFGSGWAWLIARPKGELVVASTPNQDNPIMGEFIGACGCPPLLTIDVWEHAYYLKYRNLRGEYLKNIWNIIDWDMVNKRFES